MQQTITLRPARRAFSPIEWGAAKGRDFVNWLRAESPFLTALLEERTTPADVLLALGAFALLTVGCGLAEWLEGGAL